MLVDLEQYKIARQFLKSLPDIYTEIDRAYAAFSKYAVYRPVGDILRALKEERRWLEIHEMRAREILKDVK